LVPSAAATNEQAVPTFAKVVRVLLEIEQVVTGVFD
jgi:hypothetical protein